MPKRRRGTPTPTRPSHCTSCGEPMAKLACSIDFHAVYVGKLVREFMERHGRIPDEAELQEMDDAVGSDPCDDCCCGGCGARKEYPGQAHC